MNPKPYSLAADSASGESFTVTDYYEGGKHVGRLIRDSGGNAVHKEGRYPALDVIWIEIPDNLPWN
jgi:hypothetical protein